MSVRLECGEQRGEGSRGQARRGLLGVIWSLSLKATAGQAHWSYSSRLLADHSGIRVETQWEGDKSREMARSGETVGGWRLEPLRHKVVATGLQSGDRRCQNGSVINFGRVI